MELLVSLLTQYFFMIHSNSVSIPSITIHNNNSFNLLLVLSLFFTIWYTDGNILLTSIRFTRNSKLNNSILFPYGVPTTWYTNENSTSFFTTWYTNQKSTTQYTNQNSNNISPLVGTVIEWIHGIIMVYNGDSDCNGGRFSVSLLS